MGTGTINLRAAANARQTRTHTPADPADRRRTAGDARDSRDDERARTARFEALANSGVTNNNQSRRQNGFRRREIRYGPTG